MTSTEELLRRAGEAPLDAWMLRHPYLVLFGIPGLCLVLSAYVLWATDPYSRVLVWVCAWHRGGMVPQRLVRWPWLGRRWLWLLETARPWPLRLPVDFTNGPCPECASRLRKRTDDVCLEAQRRHRWTS